MNHKFNSDKIFSKKTAVYFAVTGVVLISISLLTSKSQNIQKQSNYTYDRYLESRLEEILQDAGCGKTSVLITTKESSYKAMENATEQTSLFSFSSKDNTDLSSGTGEIAGVVIVCSTIKEISDFNIIKEAASTALDIPKNKIYIFGGVANP